MSGRYPSEEELEKIRYWKGTLNELIEFLQEIWEYNGPELREGRSSHDRKKIYKLDIHSWGWSGNEDIIEALKHTMFWLVCWAKSTRGGHYSFEIQTWALHSKETDWGDPIGEGKCKTLIKRSGELVIKGHRFKKNGQCKDCPLQVMPKRGKK